jgi:WD40 repeat protein
LLDLAWVRERALDSSKQARAIALRAVLSDLLPYGLDHPYAGVLRALAGLEPGTAGRSRDERQRIAGEWLGPARHPATPRSVRRRVRQHCWPWLLDRLIERELEHRDAADADKAPSRSHSSQYLALIPDLAASLIERADQQRRLLGLLLSRDRGSVAARPSVVSIRGPAGFGKTTLAQQICHSSAVRSAFSDGLLWVETGEHCDAARVVQLISDLCFQLEAERPEITDPEQAGFHLARVLGDRRILLVIDNAWSARDLSPFLIGAPNCTRLVTTRNARVCSSHTAELVLEPMSTHEIERLLEMQLEGLSSDRVRPLAGACHGWPLLAQIVAGAVRHDMLAGASPDRALTVAEAELRSAGPRAFDVWDDDDRQATIHQAIDASLESLERHVAVAGRQGIRDAYLSLAVFPGATAIPLNVLTVWWGAVHGWTAGQVRHLCRLLADRSLLGAYRADTESIVLHDVFRVYLRHEIDDRAPTVHRSLIDAHRPPVAAQAWWHMAPTDPYMWAHLIHHLHEADLADELVATLSHPEYIVTKAALLGPAALQTDLTILDSAGHSGDHVARQMLSAAFLFSGMTREQDIAATLLSFLERSNADQEVRGQVLQLLTSEREDFRTSWWAALGADDEDPRDGHVGAITAVATTVVEADDVVVSGGEDGTVRVWNVGDRSQRAICAGHTGWVDAVAVSTQNALIASAGEDSSIRLWDVASGEPRGVLSGHAARIRSLAIDREGDRLVSGGEDSAVCLWDLATQRLLDRFDWGRPVWCVAISPDAKILAVGGQDHVLQLFDVESWQKLDEMIAHRDWVRTAAFSPTDGVLASGSGDRRVRLWSVDERLRRLETLQAGGSRVRCVAFSGDGGRVAAGCEDGIVRVWNRATFQPPIELDSGVDWVRAVCFGADEQSVVGGCEDGVVRLWDVANGARATELGRRADAAWSVAFASDDIAIAGRADGRIELRNSATGRAETTFSAGDGRVWSVAASRTASPRIAAACGDGAVRLWSTRDGGSQLVFEDGRHRAWSVAIDPQGRLLAAGMDAGLVRVWDIDSRELIFESQPSPGRIRSVTFNEAGQCVAWGCGDGAVRTWQPGTGGASEPLGDTGGWVRSIAVDPAGRYIGVGAGSGEIQVWDRDTTTLRCRLVGHGGRVLSLAFTPGVDRLISGAADGTVRLWSLTDASELCQLRLDASLLTCVTDASQGHALVATPHHLTLVRLHAAAAKGSQVDAG